MAASENWVINASPLICLGKLGCLDWLGVLASELVVPSGVAAEIEAGPADDGARAWLRSSGAQHVRASREIAEEITGWGLGRGESEVLSWARAHQGSIAVLDDRAARRCASVFNLPVLGTVGILMRAKRRNLIPQLSVIMDKAAKVGLYISPAVRREALRLVGE